MNKERIAFIEEHVKPSGMKIGAYVALLIDKDMERKNKKAAAQK